MPRVILFDVNETLLDLQALTPYFERIFSDAATRSQWFDQVLRSAFVATLTDTYHDFGVIAKDALEMTAMRHGITLTEDDRGQILGTMRALPPHPEVPESLERLKAAGLRLATLTNSPPQVLEAQLSQAGIFDYFEQTLSVHPTRRFKPAPEPYQHAAHSLGVALSDIRMVAAHDWDVAGAMRVGCAAAFVARPGMVLGPLQAKPDIMGANLREVADQILAMEV
jgi:2-haloacid dehalogenase